MVDRVARTIGYEVRNDGRLTATELRDTALAVAAGAPAGDTGVLLRVIAHARTSYDGDAFVGLPFGALGDHGLPTRVKTLAFTDAYLDHLFDPADLRAATPWPVYLNPGGVTAWPAEYPVDFRTRLPALAGYVHHTDGEIPGSPGGYYAPTARHRYDVHDPGHIPRGLPIASLDPLGAQTTVD